MEGNGNGRGLAIPRMPRYEEDASEAPEARLHRLQLHHERETGLLLDEIARLLTAVGYLSACATLASDPLDSDIESLEDAVYAYRKRCELISQMITAKMAELRVSPFVRYQGGAE